jgi:hypothetical protein
MMDVTVRTQAELDQALADKTETIYIDASNRIGLRIDQSGSAHVVARGSAHVEARGSAHVEAWGSAHVVAWGSAHVEAWGSAHVEARDSAHVVAWDSSHVEARGSAHVVARDSSHVEAWDSAHVEARGSSHVEAWDSAHVVAWDSAHVVAWDSAHVEARGSAHVVAETKYVGIHLYSQSVQLDGNGTVIDCTDIDLSNPRQWCEFHGVEIADGIAYVFKAVNQEWTTDRNTDYSPGSLPEAADWDAEWLDCGRGLHFCDHPLRSLSFLGGRTDDARFLKVGVRLDEMVPLGDKVKARRAVVACVEVDRYGRSIDIAAVTA